MCWQDSHEVPNHYVNTIVGPLANRIANAQFNLQGRLINTHKNDADNTLHGGKDGLSEQYWQVIDQCDDRLSFCCTLSDGHMGFAGPSRFQAQYQLEDDGLSLRLCAECDFVNAFNLVPHWYFNLDGSPSIDAHILQLPVADYYLPCDEQMIPLSKPVPVSKTRMDFRQAKSNCWIILR